MDSGIIGTDSCNVQESGMECILESNSIYIAQYKREPAQIHRLIVPQHT